MSNPDHSSSHVDDQFSPAQLNQMRAVLREEFSRVGLDVTESEDVTAAREDFRFVRKMRRMVDSASAKVGTAVILGFIGFFAWAIMTAANLWNSRG